MIGEDWNKEYLNPIDFLPYIEKFKGHDIEEMISAIEDDYNGTPLTDNELLEGCIFNWLNTEELIDYLTERYGEEKFKYIRRSVTFIV